MTVKGRELIVVGEPASDDRYALDAEIKRLRVMLALMKPETGASALGALRQAAPSLPLIERVKIAAGLRR